MLMAVVVLLVAGSAHTQTPATPLARFTNPPSLSTPTGYTHVVEVLRGRTVYIAGQVALDRQGTLVGKGDFQAQTKQVFENLSAALAAVGATFEHVVKMNTFVTDMGQVQALREIRTQYIGRNPPANTLVGVVRLAREEFLIEIEAIAVVPDGPAIRPAAEE
jgi:reactive intermediate/imine deaminase